MLHDFLSNSMSADAFFSEDSTSVTTIGFHVRYIHPHMRFQKKLHNTLKVKLFCPFEDLRKIFIYTTRMSEVKISLSLTQSIRHHHHHLHE